MDAGLSFLDGRHPYLDIAHIVDDPIELFVDPAKHVQCKVYGFGHVSIYMGRIRAGKEVCSKMLVIVFNGPVYRTACGKPEAHTTPQACPFRK